MSRLAWTTLLGCAIAGTEKRAPDAFAGVSGEDREALALTSAAVLATSMAAGFAPPAGGLTPITEAPPETRPVVVNGAGHLARCLDLSPLLVKEWLKVAAEAQVIVPPECLIGVLEFGRKDKGERDAVRKVIGGRGQWLAGLNPSWGYAVGSENDQEIWEHGTASDRIDAFERLRASDPTFARELAVGSFTHEPAEFREAVVTAMRIGLRSGDEAFLQEALGDRSISVREAAIGNLVLICGSEASKAIAEISRGFLKVTKGLLKKSIDLELPPIQEPPKGAADTWLGRLAQIWPKPLTGKGWRESLMMRIVTIVPPQFWLDSTGLSREELIRWANKGEYGEAWFQGLQGAMVHFADPSWFATFYEMGLNVGVTLLQAAPVHQRDRALTATIPKGDASGLQSALTMVPQWSPELSRAVMTWIRNHLQKPGAMIYLDVVDIALRMPVDCYVEALAMVTSEREQALGRWRDVLPLVKDMRETIWRTARG